MEHNLNEGSILSNNDHMDISLDLFPCASCIIQYNEQLTILKLNQWMRILFDFQELCEGKGLKNILSEKDYTNILDIINDNKHKKIDRFQFQSCFVLNKQVFQFAYEGMFILQKEAILFTITDVTQYRDVELELNYIRQQHDILMNQTGHIVSQYDICTRTLYQPEKAANIFGLPRIIEGAPYSIVDKVIADESKQEYVQFYESMIAGIPHAMATVRAHNISNEYAWYVMQYDLVYDVNNTPTQAIISYEDVTDLQEKELVYKKWQNYFQSQQEKSIAYYEYNLTKDYFEMMDGELTEQQKVQNFRTLQELISFALEHNIQNEDCEKYTMIFSRQRLLAQFYEGERECRFEHRRIKKDGSAFWALAVIQLVSDPYTNDIMASILIIDIDDDKKSLLQLRQLSMMDPLTGLLNRTTMIHQVDALLQSSDLCDTHVLLMIDLDDFKILNDTKGHKFGDQVLLDFAKDLSSAIRAGDLCARLGGDEFVVLLKNTPIDESLFMRIQTFHNRLNRKYDTLKASTSIGLASFPKDGWSFDDLYQKADIALYQAKRNGRNQFCIYDAKNIEIE